MFDYCRILEANEELVLPCVMCCDSTDAITYSLDSDGVAQTFQMIDDETFISSSKAF